MIFLAYAVLVGFCTLVSNRPRRVRSRPDWRNYGESWRSKRQRARDRRAWRHQQDQAIFAAMNTALSASKEKRRES